MSTPSRTLWSSSTPEIQRYGPCLQLAVFILRCMIQSNCTALFFGRLLCLAWLTSALRNDRYVICCSRWRNGIVHIIYSNTRDCWLLYSCTQRAPVVHWSLEWLKQCIWACLSPCLQTMLGFRLYVAIHKYRTIVTAIQYVIPRVLEEFDRTDYINLP